MFHKLHRWLLVVACALGVTGCLRVDEQFDLKADGRGTLQVEVGLESARLDAIRQAAIRSADQPGIPAVKRPDYLLDFAESHIAGSLRNNLEKGLELERVERRESNGWSFVSIRVRFDRVAALEEDLLLGQLAPRLHNVAPGVWRLVQPPLIASPKGAGTGLDRNRLPELPGFEAHIRWSLPGDKAGIVSGPASLKEGALEWRIVSRPEQPDPAARKPIEVEFSGQALSFPDETRYKHAGAERGGT